jgi:transcription elongation GreA/GreB family factor
MPGYKAASPDDTSGKYQIRRHRIDISIKDKKHRDIIRTNLDYDEAMAQIKRFNEIESRSHGAKASEQESENEDQTQTGESVEALNESTTPESQSPLS